MSILICDICGTSYSDSAEKCPTCGYGRAFDAAELELELEAERTHAAHKKTRGGRFSKRNVRKRMLVKDQAGQEAGAHEHPDRRIPVILSEQETLPPVSVPDNPAAQPEPAAEAQPTEQETPPEQTAEEERKKKLLADYRRDVKYNLVLFFSAVLLIGSIVYLAMTVDFSRIGDFFRPDQTVIATDSVTDPPTDPLA